MGLALCIYNASVGTDANMGRSVCAEEKIEKSVDLFYKQPWTIGLIIGQVTWIYMCNVYNPELRRVKPRGLRRSDWVDALLSTFYVEIHH